MTNKNTEILYWFLPWGPNFFPAGVTLIANEKLLFCFMAFWLSFRVWGLGFHIAWSALRSGVARGSAKC